MDRIDIDRWWLSIIIVEYKFEYKFEYGYKLDIRWIFEYTSNSLMKWSKRAESYNLARPELPGSLCQ
jgi:hypothetical protein